ncbi:hypothetical protein BH11CYA1_BH11CYA1_39670 [soil metagenome]
MQNQELELRFGVIEQLRKRCENFLRQLISESRIKDAEYTTQKLQRKPVLPRSNYRFPVSVAPSVKPPTAADVTAVRAKMTHNRLQSLQGYLDDSKK